MSLPAVFTADLSTLDYTSLSRHEQFIYAFKEAKRLHSFLKVTVPMLKAGIDTRLFNADTIRSMYPEYFI